MSDDFSSDIDRDVNGMRIGIPAEYFNGVDSEVTAAVMSAVALLEKKGARIVNLSLRCTEYAIPVYYLIATAEASSNLARFDGVRYGYRSPQTTDLESLYVKSRSEGFGKEVKRRIMLGTFSLSSGYYDAYYLKALKGRSLIIEDFKNAFSQADIIITPVTTKPAFKIGEMISDPLQMYMSDILTISANLSGIPGISVPVGLSSRCLPIGLQIMAGHFDEKKMFRAARAVEEENAPLVPKL
jgi:aspartyl-tRNA(Asn)/glutamyl-tRNA(Gln) amidotransferase subunit A